MRRRVGSPEPPSDDQAEEADLAVAHAGRDLGDVGERVIAVRAGNPHGLRDWADLARPVTQALGSRPAILSTRRR